MLFSGAAPGKAEAGPNVNQILLDYYRLSADLFPSSMTANNSVSGDSGFFQLGPGNICYGQCHTGVATDLKDSGTFDALKHVHLDGKTVQLPFAFTEVVENLRRERYQQKKLGNGNLFLESDFSRRLYYFFRDYLPFSIRRRLQKIYFRDWKELPFPAWPVDFTVDKLHEAYLQLFMEATGRKRVPFIWFWPEGAPSCLILTHDVETRTGRDFTSRLMDLDDSYGIKASFQVIPEKRYEVPDEYVSEIRSRGFEFNVHDLNHDGCLYLEHKEFLRRAARINAYIHRYESRGFRAGSMYRNQDWYDAFDFSFDMSVPNVAHLDPMHGGCCTVMPYFVGKIVELPVTTSQDYTLFHILNDYSIDLWKQQTALIGRKNGLISVLTHPDYLFEERARHVYSSLLEHVRTMIDREKIWVALPGDVDLWWRTRRQMKLVRKDNEWEITGPEKERARLAYAILDEGRLLYELAEVPSQEHLARLSPSS
jgi:hypothetical protein